MEEQTSSVAQPQVAQAQVAQPQAAQPQVAQPQAAQPQVAQPQVAQPQAAQPQAAEPQAGQSQSILIHQNGQMILQHLPKELMWVDYTIIAVIAMSVLLSLWRGFTKEALSVATWALAIWVSIQYAQPLSHILTPYLEDITIRIISAYAILVIMTLLFGTAVSFFASKVIHISGLGLIDRLLGVVFGVARGSIIITLVVLCLGVTSITKESWWQKSTFLPHFQQLALWLREHLPEDMRTLISYGEEQYKA